MSAIKRKETDYKNLLRNVEKEDSAKGKCRWIAAILELMITNDLHALFCGQSAMKEIIAKVNKSINRLVLMLVLVLAVVLVTNPQVANLVGRFIALIF